MARSWIIDFRGFARKVKNTTLSTDDQIKDCGAYLDCPKCHYRIHNSDVFPEWPGFPAGVKFDPSDVELLKHLAAKCCIGSIQPHMSIHEFIPTLEGDQGICYTHPKHLPGAKKDGSSAHFFNRTVNAYASGQRKRRKINHQHGLPEEHVRWHKTGKTKPVIEDGVHKGFKKIMVLYVRSQKGSKEYKSNWVMHQYHLGSEEEEKDGEYVVSKVFYQQQKQTEKNEKNPMAEGSDMALRTSLRTLHPNPPSRPHSDKGVDCNGIFDENELPSLIEGGECIPEESHAPPSDVENEDNMGDLACLAGESQDVRDFGGLNDILWCKEMLDSSKLFNGFGLNSSTFNSFTCHENETPLDTLALDTPQDIDFSVFPEWTGFPAGVKFDPSDVELLEHLAAKCFIGNRETNKFIHKFIPSLEGDQGICYTHPENLPGAKKDGSSIHFFNKTLNAYASGQRKRRKIHHQQGLPHEEHVGWHKTGKTKAVIKDGVHKGFQKIMVLYVKSQKGSKPYKSNWVMHQYHLGSEEEEKDGEYVVSKVFYQPHKQTEKIEENPVAESRTSPITRKPNPPSQLCDYNFDDKELPSPVQDSKPIPGESHAPPSDVKNEDNMGDPAWLACFDGLDDIIPLKEMLGYSSGLYNDSGLNSSTLNNFTSHPNEASYDISILGNFELDTPPDFDFSLE